MSFVRYIKITVHARTRSTQPNAIKRTFCLIKSWQ